MRRQPPPSHRPSHAKLIEPFRIVVRNPPRQNLPLPCVRGNFESLQLLQYFQRPPLSGGLGARSHMLPAEEPPQKLRSRDRLNLLSQHPYSQAVNARQQPPLAPFNLSLPILG